MSQREKIKKSVERQRNWREALEKKIAEHQAEEKASRPTPEQVEEK